MIDIYTKNMALKAAWVKRFMSDDNHAFYPIIKHCTKPDVKFLLQCNISPTDMHHYDDVIMD